MRVVSPAQQPSSHAEIVALLRTRTQPMVRTLAAAPFPSRSLSALTHVYRAHVLAALTRPLARHLCLLRPPPPSPAPCRACDGRAHRSCTPASESGRYW